MREYKYKNYIIEANRWEAWSFLSRQFPKDKVVLTA